MNMSQNSPLVCHHGARRTVLDVSGMMPSSNTTVTNGIVAHQRPHKPSLKLHGRGVSEFGQLQNLK